MTETQHPYSCSTCQLSFRLDTEYKLHFKSELHRYNLKRKVIGLPSATESQYLAQFQAVNSKSTSQAELRCGLCSKTFMSARTYAQHVTSTKHKQRAKAQEQRTLAKTKSASSEFSVISLPVDTTDYCIFCHKISDECHMMAHNFPPFAENCVNLPALKSYVKSIIESKHCVYCRYQFDTIQAARQHMVDVGHAMINTEEFAEFQEFYVWSIQEEHEEQASQQWEELEEKFQKDQQKKKLTLQDVKNFYKGRIEITKIGARINGKKQIGVRCLKNYYKQYFRNIIKIPRNMNIAIENKENSGNQHLSHFLPNKAFKNSKCCPGR